MDSEIGIYIHTLKEKYALDVSMYDRSFLEKAIKYRMTASSFETIDDYILHLGMIPDEVSVLMGQLCNSYSEFFRNPLTFSILEHVIFPKIFNDRLKQNGREIRIWSAGCASGQEAYSLAIILDNFKNTHFTPVSYRIFATDNSVGELDLARKGIFDFKTVKNTKLEYAKKYFKCSAETYQIDDKLKEQVDFSEYDLLDKDSSSPQASIFGDFDLIMCSNVLFYYELEYQQMILQKIYRSLKPGGFFITGEAEKLIVNSFKGFSPFLVPAAIFVKN